MDTKYASALDAVLSVLDNVKKTPNGYECSCPAHDDKKPSCLVGKSSNGGVNITCQVGCSKDAIEQALAVRLNLDEWTKAHYCDSFWQEQEKGDDVKFSLKDSAKDDKPKKRHATAQDAIKAQQWSVELGGAKVVSHEPNLYENGKPFGYNVRFNLADGSKTYKQIHRDGDAWISGAGNNLWPVGRLNDLPDEGIIYLHEGEKACAAGWALNIPSTCSKGGCSAPKNTDWSTLKGRRVVILPDNDAGGEKFASEMTRRLHDIDCVVIIVRLPGRPDGGGDLADLLEQCRDTDEKTQLLDQILALSAVTRPEQRPGIVPITELIERNRPEPYPLSAFPQGIRDFISESAKSICCDPVMIANPLLSGLASVAGGSHNVEIKPGWVEPVIVWTMTVTDSGNKKSPSFNAALKGLEEIEFGLEEQNISRQRDHSAKLREYESDLAIWKAQRREQIRKPDSAKICDQPPIEPDRYCDKICVVSDITIEALSWALENNNNGLLLAVDELSGWIQGFDRYGGAGEVAKWLELHSGGRIRVDRAGNGRKFVSDPRLSIAGGIQPWVLQKVAGQEHTANGLLQRFLVAQPEKLKRRLDTPQVGFAANEFIRSAYRGLRSMAVNTVGLGTLQLSPEAFSLFAEFYAQHADKQDEAAGAEAGMLAKIEAAAARLAAVLYMTKSVQEDGIGDIDAESMAGGIALANWYVKEWERLYRGNLSPEEDADDVLLTYLAKHDGKVMRSKIMQSVRRYRKAELLDNAIIKLCRSGQIKVEMAAPGAKGGTASQWITLNGET